MNEKPRVLIAAAAMNDEQITMLENAGCEVLVAQEPYEESIYELLPACHGLCLGIFRITGDLLQRCLHLMVVARHGVGTDNVDVEAATRLGIYVTCTPGANTNAVAEFTMGAVVCLSRSIVEGDRRMKRAEWRDPSLWGWELSDKTMGILGLGRVGQKTARLAHAFGMEVLAHDPYQDDSIFKAANATKVDLEELLSRSQYLCLHTSLTKETRGLLDRRRLETMPKGSYLINMARAEVVDSEALKILLDSGHIAGSALDVFEEEPPKDWELARHPRVLATPHIAAWSHEARKGMNLGAASEVITALRGQRPKNAVNSPESPRIRQLIR
jgi:D-3-phosphoglycerate dehydrogenase